MSECEADSWGDFETCCLEVIIKYANEDILILAYNDTFKKPAALVKNYHQVKEKTEDNQKDCNSIISVI
ncbi:MAG: hypothetical protein LBR47_06385 [Spirochaetaceae bacterium]|nr:hypothetical protein [Spirochaetaceae bacterium]